MKAMILAAGRGERMRPLTDATPKPLLTAAGRHLIEYHIDALVAAGITGIVINHAWLGAQIEASLGDGNRYGARIVYSPEGDQALETGGGIVNALPLLGSEPFVVINGDVYTEYPLSMLKRQPNALAHIVLIPNPPHNVKGDFSLSEGYVSNTGSQMYTFSGISVYRPEFFAGCRNGIFPLAKLLRRAADAQQLTGEIYEGYWMDIGTPERLQQLDAHLTGNTGVSLQPAIK